MIWLVIGRRPEERNKGSGSTQKRKELERKRKMATAAAPVLLVQPLKPKEVKKQLKQFAADNKAMILAKAALAEAMDKEEFGNLARLSRTVVNTALRTSEAVQALFQGKAAVRLTAWALDVHECARNVAAAMEKVRDHGEDVSDFPVFPQAVFERAADFLKLRGEMLTAAAEESNQETDAEEDELKVLEEDCEYELRQLYKAVEAFKDKGGQILVQRVQDRLRKCRRLQTKIEKLHEEATSTDQKTWLRDAKRRFENEITKVEDDSALEAVITADLVSLRSPQLAQSVQSVQSVSPSHPSMKSEDVIMFRDIKDTITHFKGVSGMEAGHRTCTGHGVNWQHHQVQLSEEDLG